MEGIQVGKTFLKIVAWIAASVIVPILTALGLKNIFNIDSTGVILAFAAFYVICFIVAFIFHLFKDVIKKQVYDILYEEKIINKSKRKRK